MAGYEMLEVGGVKTEGEQAPVDTPEVPATETTPTTVDAPAPVEAPAVEDVAPETSKETEEPAPAEDVVLYWGEHQIDVDMPEEISSAFAEAGIDGKAVLAELYAQGGNFELTDKTKELLVEKFGKPLVEGYLGMYKMQNEMAIADYERQQADLTATIQTNSAECDGIVSAVGGWEGLNEWAVNSMDDKQLNAFNAVMSLGVEHWVAQKTVIESLVARMGDGNAPLKLLTDDMSGGDSAPAGAPQTLTAAQFQEAMYSDKYRNDRNYAAQIDNIRRQSQKAGIR